jgi:hypothetical protein
MGNIFNGIPVCSIIKKLSLSESHYKTDNTTIIEMFKPSSIYAH